MQFQARRQILVSQMRISSGSLLPIPSHLVHSSFSVVASVTMLVARRSSLSASLDLLAHLRLVASLLTKECSTAHVHFKVSSVPFLHQLRLQSSLRLSRFRLSALRHSVSSVRSQVVALQSASLSVELLPSSSPGAGALALTLQSQSLRRFLLLSMSTSQRLRAIRLTTSLA